MYCPGCGKQIDDDSEFCEFCGTHIEPDDAAEEAITQAEYAQTDIQIYPKS